MNTGHFTIIFLPLLKQHLKLQKGVPHESDDIHEKSYEVSCVAAIKLPSGWWP